MIREELMKRARPEGARPNPTAFRWRGGDVSRIEGFSDAAFGFALTLLVVSLSVPENFTELTRSMRQAGTFAVCFTLLSLVWYDHYLFFRQYGLKDTLTVVLGLASMLLADLRSPQSSLAAGAMYWTIGLWMSIYWSVAGTRRKKLEVRALEAAASEEE